MSKMLYIGNILKPFKRSKEKPAMGELSSSAIDDINNECMNMNCMICKSKSPSYIIPECGHYCVCKNCKKYVEKYHKECPICGVRVQKKLKKVKTKNQKCVFCSELCVEYLIGDCGHCLCKNCKLEVEGDTRECRNCVNFRDYSKCPICKKKALTFIKVLFHTIANRVK